MALNHLPFPSPTGPSWRLKLASGQWKARGLIKWPLLKTGLLSLEAGGQPMSKSLFFLKTKCQVLCQLQLEATTSTHPGSWVRGTESIP